MNMKIKLTSHQRRILNFLRKPQNAHSSVRCIGKHLGIKSPSQTQAILMRLVFIGMLKKDPAVGWVAL